ncbi:MAG: hypothetical protein U1D55_05110 [Phycisphaerae bacterium]
MSPNSRVFLSSAFGVLTALNAAAQNATIVGLDSLRLRIGAANTPTGAPIVIGQVEAPIGTAYQPDPADAQFVGKTFFAQSGSPGVFSSHATPVAQNLCGVVSSVSPGVSQIYNWEANNWVQSYIRVLQGANFPPLTPPGGLKVFNHSWVGTFGSGSVDNETLRRMDFAISRDNVLVFAGMNNSGSTPALMASGYGVISVGRRDGLASITDSASNVDVPGRMKPEMVGPGNLTSFTTPVAAACGSLLVEIVRTTPALAANSNAEKADTLKAILLAGCRHETGWTNNAPTSGPTRGVVARSLDDALGAGTVNIDNAHMIATALEQNAATAPPTGANASSNGWDRVDVPLNTSAYWRFHVTSTAAEVSIAATWQRFITITFGGPSIANFDLTLWRVDATGALVSLAGDAGAAFFSGGNVVSQSTIDNVEHLYITGLGPGDYVLELQRLDSLTNFPNWTAAVAWIFSNCSGGLVGDLNADHVVDESDLGQLLAAWQAGPSGDLDGDGDTDESDLGILLGSWGRHCP